VLVELIEKNNKKAVDVKGAGAGATATTTTTRDAHRQNNKARPTFSKEHKGSLVDEQIAVRQELRCTTARQRPVVVGGVAAARIAT
jgi:hypothetical protein